MDEKETKFLTFAYDTFATDLEKAQQKKQEKNEKAMYEIAKMHPSDMRTILYLASKEVSRALKPGTDLEAHINRILNIFREGDR